MVVIFTIHGMWVPTPSERSHQGEATHSYVEVPDHSDA